MINRKILRLFQLACAFVVGLLPIIYICAGSMTQIARAEEAPTAIAFITGKTKAFQNLFENGDTLFISEVNLTVSENVTKTPPELFQYTLYETDGLTSIAARDVKSLVYGYNVVGLYFSAANTASMLTWGSSYVIRIMGQPEEYPSPEEDVNMDSYTMTNNDWINGTFGSSLNKGYVKDYCISIATSIQTNWTQTLITLVGTGYVLNSLGRNVFLLAVPNFDYAVPLLFQTTYNNPNIDNTTKTQDLQSLYTPLGQLGTSTKAAFDGIGEYLGFSGEMLGSAWAFMLILMVASIAFLYTGNTTASIIIAIPMAFIGLISGFFPVYVFLLVLAFLLIGTGYYLFLRGI